MKNNVLTFLLLLEPLGFAFADSPKTPVPAPATRIAFVRGDAKATKVLEAKKRSKGNTGTKRPPKPKKTSTQS
jgi:hypothetical protein